MNEIITSHFTGRNSVHTAIRNPSEKVLKFMDIISEEEEIRDGIFFYRHRDIGTRQDMEKMFALLV